MTSPITDERLKEPEILTCPFCGGPALEWRAFSASQKASCRDITCAGYRVVATVDEWNRRAPSAELLAAREALHKARAVIQEDRDEVFDCVTVAGIASTMAEIDRPSVERMDAVLREIDAALAEIGSGK